MMTDFSISPENLSDPLFWFISILTSLVQGGFIIGGVIFICIGLLMAYSELFTSKDQRITKAKIIGVRAGKPISSNSKGQIYYPVFEYVGDNGQIIQAESLSGSSYLRNKFPGDFTKIKVSHDSPDWVSPVGKIWLIIALVFCAVGGVVIFGATTFAKVTYITLGVWGYFILQILFKLRKIVIPKRLRESKANFRIRINQKRDDQRKSLPLLDKNDVFLLLKEEDRIQQRIYPLALLIAVGFIASGYFFYDKENKFIMQANVTTGTYAHLESSQPRVTYYTQDGNKQTYRDEFFRFFPSSYSLNAGDEIQVYYVPSSPSKAVIGRGIWQGLYYKILMGFGVLMLVQSIMAASRRKNRMSRI